MADLRSSIEIAMERTKAPESKYIPTRIVYVHAYLNKKNAANEIVAKVTAPLLFDGQRNTPFAIHVPNAFSKDDNWKCPMQAVYGSHVVKAKAKILKKETVVDFIFKMPEHGAGGGGGRIAGGSASATATARSEARASIGDTNIKTGDVNVNIPPRGPGFGEIHGRILHSPEFWELGSRIRYGVPGAYVRLQGTGYATRANYEGFYVIPNVKPGNYTVRAEQNKASSYAPYGYIPNQAKIAVKADEDEECDIELEAIEKEKEKPKIPKPGYHVVSTKPSHWKRLFGASGGGPRVWPYKRTHECETCHKKTLVEEYDKKTGQIYYRCANKDCPDFQAGRKLTPNDIGIAGRKTPLLGMNAREHANKRLVWEERMRDLRMKYKNDEISEEEFIEEKKRINREIYGDENKKGGGVGVVTRVGGPMAQFSRGFGSEVKKGIFAAFIIGAGAVVAAMLGNWWFFIGFLSIGLNVLTPSPDSGKFQEGPMGWGHIMPWAQGGSHAGFAWIKSITKVTAIITFASGFKAMGDVFNTLFVITCLAGYFSLKVGYDPKRPGEFIESLLRFGILGCYFIPFVVFAGIFNSYVLAAIALAFFAIPPMPDTAKFSDIAEVLARGLSGQTAYYEMFDKMLFAGLMLFALLGSGVLGDLPIFGTLGWALTGTLKATFIYFWLIAGIGGFFSPARERPMTGILFLGGATIIYAVGPGSQDVGSALLGQWWPSVNQAMTSISDPISKMFGQLGSTFGNAFLLLTNPVGYATQLMNGSYSNNPAGETGAYGIELSGFDVSPVFIEQPFMITANIKNNGAYDAEGLAIALSVGPKAPELRSNWIPGLNPQTGSPTMMPGPVPGSKDITITGVGIKNDNCEQKIPWSSSVVDANYICVHNYATSQGGSGANLMMPFTRQNVWQTVFSSAGLSCQNSASYELRKKSIPVNLTLIYKYQSDSRVPIEFMSQAEWDRLGKLDQLTPKLQFVTSQYSSAPVKFPIGTPGLKNPILETQDFHVALNIMSAQAGGKIDSIQSIVLSYPADFDLATDGCNPAPDTSVPGTAQNGIKTITWTNKQSGDQIFFCHFNALKPTGGQSKLGTSPTKTYIVTAHANYTYTNSQQKLIKVEFGSWCCTQEPIKDSCASNQQCCPENQQSGKGICAPKTQSCQGGATTGVATATDGCCQFASSCNDVASSSSCSDVTSAFIAGWTCSQTTGRCQPKKTVGCCQAGDSVAPWCYDVTTSTCPASSGGGTFAANKACNSGTGLCS